MDTTKLRYLAGSFLTAYINLCAMNAEVKDPIFVVPMVVNGAFSAELSLKAILAENGIEYGKEHNLLYLFSLLPDDMLQEVVQRSWERTPAFRDTKVWINQLCLISDAFEEWRYGFEAKHALIVDTNFLQAFAQALSITLHAHYGDAEMKLVKVEENDETIEKKFQDATDNRRQAAIEHFDRIVKKDRSQK